MVSANELSLSQRTERVLIVDDATIMRDYLRNMLSELGFCNFIEAATADETFNIFSEKSPDLIFLDIELAEENGLDILDKLKKIDSTAQIAIVSAHSTIDNVKKAMDLGAKGFMVKPYKPKKLLSTLKNMGVQIT